MLYSTVISKPLVAIVISILITTFSACSRQQKEPEYTSEHDAKSLALSQAFFDQHPTDHPTSYLYVPGLMATEVMMGRYCPSFTASTGEKITWRSGGHVIGQPHSSVIFPETDLSKPGSFAINPITAMIYGFRRDLFPVGKRIFEEKYDATVQDNPASSTSVLDYTLNLGQANIAQTKDIKTLYAAYRKHVKKYPDTDVILYGDSRGAATIFNLIAKHKPAQVKAAVLEGIFDDIPHGIKHFIYSDKGLRAEKRLHKVGTFVMGSYNKKGPFPRQYAETITDDIPLLFVTSLKDGLVPPQSTIYLYKRLRERGFDNVHLLVLKDSIHPSYMLDNPRDKKLYESVVHAFYKHYGLPYNEARATEGATAFVLLQPTAAQIKKLYSLPECPAC